MTYLTTCFPCESPVSVAAEKAAQFYSLLFMLSDYAGSSDTFGDLNREFQSGVLSLAAGIAQEARVLSELAAGHEDGEEVG